MDKIRCSHCDRRIYEGLRFCPYCGHEQNRPLSGSDYQKDPYEILQVSRDAEPEVIKAAYKSLAKKYHPDTQHDSISEERMKEINWAFDVLSNPEKKTQWDKKRSRKRSDYSASTETHGSRKTTEEYRETKDGSDKAKTKNGPFGEYPGDSKKTEYAKASRNQQRSTKQKYTSGGIYETEKKKNSTYGNFIVYLVWGIVGLALVLFAGVAIDTITPGITQQVDLPQITKESTETHIDKQTPTQSFYSAASQWPIVYSETFNRQVTSRWPTGDIEGGESGISNVFFSNSQYHLNSESSDIYFQPYFPQINPISNFYLSASIKKIGGSETAAYGVIFRNTEAGEYEFLISGNYYSFYKITKDEFEELIDWTWDPNIKRNEFNEYEIIAQDDSFKVYINGQHVDQVEDDSFSEGYIGLATGLFNSGDKIHVVVDDFELKAPPGENYRSITESTIIPVSTPRVRGCVNVSSLNIRKGPGLNYEVVDSIQYGNCLDLISKTEDFSWVEAEKGWLYAEYLNISQGPIEELKISTESSGTSKYKTPTSQEKDNNNNSKATDVPSNTQEPSPTNSATQPVATDTPSPSPKPTWTPACPWDDPNYPCHSTPSP